MKLSIAWIFDHIQADWKKQDIYDLVTKFNTMTAEVEHIKKVFIDLSKISLAQVKSVNWNQVMVFSPEWGKYFELPARPDAMDGQIYLIKDENKADWATAEDFHGNGNFLLPAVCCEEKLLKGGWKEEFEVEDYILELDNKSITHRPDMWGHRGFAREFAAILDLHLVPIEKFLAKKEIIAYNNKYPINIKVETEDCSRFAGIYFNKLDNRASSLKIMNRLLKVGTKPIDLIVDSTNYVMLDLSQPMHAFDVDKLSPKGISIQLANNGDKLRLLDGDMVELSSKDLIIANNSKPIALAGVMGGSSTAIAIGSKSIFVEAACFNAVSIRKTATRLHKRTDAAMRFEKWLDPNQNITALLRFIRLLEEDKVEFDAEDIVSIGKLVKETILVVDHEFLEERLGSKLTSKVVENILRKLDFQVQKYEDKEISYTITIPTFRGSRDIKIKEDILEEIARFFGFINIKPSLPFKETVPGDIGNSLKVRNIKHTMAYSLCMREVSNYPFYDEEFLRKLKWQPIKPVVVKNPVSENWKVLVTSLVPHLLKNVYQNTAEQMRFFEWARTWVIEGDKVLESKILGGVLFDKKDSLDFYEIKSLLQGLFDSLDLDVEWVKVSKPEYEWFDFNQTAHLICKGQRIGIVGKVLKPFLERLVDGNAYAFEINGNFLMTYKPAIRKFEAMPKYPTTWVDVSVLVPLRVTVADLVEALTKIDTRINGVELVDLFEKKEWEGKKSVTLRIYINDVSRTLLKEDTNLILDKATQVLQVSFEAVVR